MTTMTAKNRGRVATAAAATGTALLLTAPMLAVVAPSASAAESVSSATKRTVVSLKAPGTVGAPTKVTLSGKLSTKAGKVLKNRTVRLHARVAGSSTWTLVSTARTGKTGTYTFKASVARTTHFKSTFRAKGKFRASSSAVRTVKVAGPTTPPPMPPFPPSTGSTPPPPPGTNDCDVNPVGCDTPPPPPPFSPGGPGLPY